VAPVDLSPKWLRKIIFFQLFSTLKVGLRPSLMLEFCQFAMSLHLSLRDPDASVYAQAFEDVLEMVFS